MIGRKGWFPLAAIQVKTAIPGPVSQSLLARKDKIVPDAFDIHVPVAIARADGALVTDVDGNVFIDLAGGLGCLNVGHSAPEVVTAIQQAAANFTHTDFSVIMYESYIELAERLCALAPGSQPKKACFFNSGAEAVENAVKFARKYTGKRAIIAFEGAFHGRTNLTMGLTSRVKPYKEGFGPFAPEIYRVPFPYVYRWPGGGDEAAVAKAAAEALERAFTTMVAPEDTAAVIVEPIQGEGGFVPAPADFLLRVQEICRRHNVLLIVDEIQTGFGRTGRFFATSHFEGVEPDLMTVGKSLAAGMPLSGVIGRADIMDTPGDSTIGGTYVGNPIACAAGLAVLDVMERDRIVERAAAVGERFRQKFTELAERCPIIGDIRGIGAMIGVELVKDRETKEPAPEALGRIIRNGIQRGVITVSCGVHRNVLRLLSPLVITDEQIDEAMAVLEDEFMAAAAELG